MTSREAIASKKDQPFEDKCDQNFLMVIYNKYLCKLEYQINTLHHAVCASFMLVYYIKLLYMHPYRQDYKDIISFRQISGSSILIKLRSVCMYVHTYYKTFCWCFITKRKGCIDNKIIK